VSFAIGTLPVSVTFGPETAGTGVPRTACVFPIAPLYESPFATGASLTSLIVTTNCLSNESFGVPLSVTRTQIVYELFASKLKIFAEFSLLLAIAKDALSANGPPPQPVDCSENVSV